MHSHTDDPNLASIEYIEDAGLIEDRDGDLDREKGKKTGGTQMYRSYEDPRALSKAVSEAKAALEEIQIRMAQETDPIALSALEDYATDLALSLSELEERENFAWQDEEYEEDYARVNPGLA